MRTAKDIKAALDMDTILRAVAPAARRNRVERAKREAARRVEDTERAEVNRRMAAAGIPLRVL